MEVVGGDSPMMALGKESSTSGTYQIVPRHLSPPLKAEIYVHSHTGRTTDERKYNCTWPDLFCDLVKM